MQGEDVQDQGGPVEHLHLQALLQVPELARGGLVVQQHGVGAALVHPVVDLGELALADEGRGVRGRARLDDPPHGFGAGRAGERRELVQQMFVAAPREADQQGPLADRRAPGGG